MREIKFRAWQKFDKEMHDVSNLIFEDGRLERIELDYNPKSDWDGRHKGKPTMHIEMVELMQFTGLKDVNGVEIYEGDIVKRRGFVGDEVYFYIGEIRYAAVGVDAGQFVFRSEKAYLERMYSRYGDEVIGNIYENKELLK